MKQIRDRVKELRRVKASELVANPRNWREHPQDQQEALKGVLEEVGYADALLARELPDGRLELLDGHLRKETTPDEVVPVLVLDVNEDEANLILATHDPLAAMAKTDHKMLDELAVGIVAENRAVQDMLSDMISDPELGIDLGEGSGGGVGGRAGRKPKGSGELEISPELFERHDYLLVYFDNQMDWQVACERFRVKTVANAVIDPASSMNQQQKGTGHVIRGRDMLRELGCDGYGHD